MKKKNIILSILLFSLSAPLFAENSGSDNMIIAKNAYLFKRYEYNGQVINTMNDLEAVLSNINDAGVNDSTHYSRVFTNLAIPPAIMGSCVIGWGLGGRMARGFRFDPYIFGSGAGLLGAAVVFDILAHKKTDSAIQQYNSIVEHRIVFDTDNSTYRLGVSVNY
jgi:hypothetical protein